jgi:hypothetical protein
VFVGLLQAMSAGACAVAFRLSLTRSQPRSGLDPVTRLLVTAGRAPEAPAAARRPRWRRLPSWRAQWNKDRLLCTRPTAARRRLAVPIVLATLSVLAWALPVHPSLARFLAFALALIASGTLGEWLIALSGEDPFPVLRGLPLGVGSLWRSRATWAAIASLTLVAAHALAARPLSAQALQLFLIWAGGASLSIGILAVNYGITLFPRADVAQRLFSLALGIAIAASLMIPLLGWVTLLTAIVHSARRLPRWSRLEEAT